MRILVTGGMGILGSSLLNLLRKNFNNKDIFFLDRNRNKNRLGPLNIKTFNSIYGDFNDYKQIYKILKNKKIDVVFHLGAITQVIDAYKSPIQTFKTNIQGTINILEAIRNINKKIIFIYSSSDKAYGNMLKSEYKETDRLEGNFPYDVSKSASDLIAQSYSKTYGLRVGIIRSGNIFGPGDFNLDRLVPGVIVNSLKGKKTKVRSNGKLSRDYIYVDDTANAYIKTYEKLDKANKDLLIYNVGSRYNLSVIEIVKCIAKILNIKKNYYVIKNNSKNEIKNQRLNFKKISRELNWKQEVSLKDGLEKTINWYKNNISEFK